MERLHDNAVKEAMAVIDEMAADREVFYKVSRQELIDLIEMTEEISQDLCHEIGNNYTSRNPVTERRYRNETSTAVEAASLCAHMRDKYFID